ncbi:MAG: sugar transferase [Oscillospiraceae bacterium]|jgi:exopolysaccharide biosynthesis polyprenyl glycosylphosphotransferase|nr:sugar transferase [Oscillospiraceae bacterium]
MAEIANCAVQAESRLFYHICKRIMDVVCSAAALAVLSPIFLAVAVAIKLEDKGPVIFTQNRTGKDGKVFRMYKFRSMYVDAEKRRSELLARNEADGPLFKIADDPRVTKVGRFIRRTSIDELPQLVNILKGEMSIVGPRPLVTYEQNQCTEYQAQRLLVKPGLTCIWQVSGRSDTSFDELIEMDLEYIRNQSLWLDIKLILKTVVVVFTHKGAY